MTQHSRFLRVAVIMAGGAGERFWPLSRRNRPKQLLALNHPDRSMLSEAVERCTALVGLENTYIITGSHLVDAICEAEPAFPPENVLAEPEKRNTTGALAYTVAWMLAKYPEAGPEGISMAVTTADHRIGDEERLLAAMRTAMTAAEEKDSLVTCGIVPTHPETGFGYIEAAAGEPVLAEEGNAQAVYQAMAFHEKPDAERAARFVADGRHFWNSGMFFWRVSVFLDELKRVQPGIAETIGAMVQAMCLKNVEELSRLFSTIHSVSIDYALMEKSEKVLMVRGDFPWGDVGAWNAVALPGQCSPSGNYIVGNPVLVDCTDCIVVNEPGEGEMAVAVVGMSDVIVVAAKDALLVLPKERAQDVRTVVEELKRRGARQV